MMVMVYILPSDNKQPGYVSVSVLSVWCCFLWVREKRRVAQQVIVSNESILGSGSYTKGICIHWSDVDSLTRTGKGLFYVSGKLEKFLYAEIISKDKRKIVIRRDIENFDELIQVIENQTGKSFEAT